MAVNVFGLTFGAAAMSAAQGNAVRTAFVWNPTEPVATRPLVLRAKNWGLNLFYSHDGNKNVSEVFCHAQQNGIAATIPSIPEFEGKIGFIGGGTALFVEGGAVGEVNFTAVH